MSTAALRPQSTGFATTTGAAPSTFGSAAPPVMTQGIPATTGTVEPKAFHRQGHYRNNWFLFCLIALPIIGLVTALTALGLDIAGASIIGRGATNVFSPTGTVLWDTNRYMGLWIVAAALTPLLVLTGLISCLCGFLSWRHEKKITKFNNDANQYQHIQRDRANKTKYLFMIPTMLNQIAMLCLFGFYLAVTVVAAYRLEVSRGFSDADCLAGGATADDCGTARRGHRIMLAGGIISMLSLLPFMLLNSQANSHFGSHQRKSNVMPPQAATMTGQQGVQPSAASMI